ncbi:Ldh family oxidoreductase [Pseudonocardia endophytica]|uniref:Ldh family oxidoreductase n=1 Tax=Pseudonocardia endophytica TaxID=401976 RepID=UPI001404290F|nr:Ldh family oxidoreductase [Pseudonocardia endophytica]
MSADDLPRIPLAEYLAVGGRALTRLGAPEAVARTQVAWLTEGDLRGHPSHGLRRLEVLVGRVRSGLIVPDAPPELVRSAAAVLRVDGHDGFGPPTAVRALEDLVTIARENGVAVAAIRRAGHLGMLAPYVERLAGEGLVGLATTTSEALVHPWGAAPAMLGTNPLAVAVPTATDPVVLDMATGQISRGKVLDHAARGEPLPEGSVVDADGRATTDPQAALDGAISPFGGPKGYALALVLEVLVATLTGTALGTDVRGTLDTTDPVTKGDLLLAMDPAAFGGGTPQALTAFLDILRGLEPAPGSPGVTVPGDRARAHRARHADAGVPVHPDTWSAAVALSGG